MRVHDTPGRIILVPALAGYVSAPRAINSAQYNFDTALFDFTPMRVSYTRVFYTAFHGDVVCRRRRIRRVVNRSARLGINAINVYTD